MPINYANYPPNWKTEIRPDMARTGTIAGAHYNAMRTLLKERGIKIT